MAPGENNREIRCLKCDDYLREGLSGWHEKKNTRGGMWVERIVAKSLGIRCGSCSGKFMVTMDFLDGTPK